MTTAEILASTTTALVLPVFFSMIIFPPAEEHGVVHEDHIKFSKYKTIYFSQIQQFNLDDYIKIRRAGNITLLLQGNRKNIEHYKAFYKDFECAIKLWQQKQIKLKEALPMQTYFYGSFKARLWGGALLAGYISLLLIAIIFDANYILVIATGGAIVPVGIFLISSVRRN
ncbi:hypothetical protein C1891_28640 [Pseudomonas sp. GW456-12-1-14-TSB6]|nr:hypothetical protein C1891_28640 [Pseudomonas sp. GW456-12-1-14-TSB6]